MTPEELSLVEAGGAIVRARPDDFADRFYDTLFELAPDTRALFPDDLAEQRGKLVDELAFLVDAAAESSRSGELRPFLDRAHDLGRRHATYGVHGRHYEPVGESLVTALGEVVAGWDDRHEHAWRKLYRLVADVMREGAERDLFTHG